MTFLPVSASFARGPQPDLRLPAHGGLRQQCPNHGSCLEEDIIAAPEYRSEVLQELERIPPEFLPAALKLLRAFREGVTLPTAQESFRQGWEEALTGQTRPVSELWKDAEHLE